MPDVFDELAAKSPATKTAPAQAQVAAQGDVFDEAQASSLQARSKGNGLPPGQLPLSSYKNATLQGLANIGEGVNQAIGAIPQMVMHPIDTAKGLIGAPGRAIQGVKDFASDVSSSPHPYETALSESARPIGNAAGQAVVAAAAPEAPKIAKAVVPPVVRGLAKGANTILEKAPGSVGGAVGAGLGGAVGGSTGAEIGGAAGYAIGREVLPKMHIPGEEFGLPKVAAEAAPKAPAIAKPEPIPSAKPVEAPLGPKKPSYVDHAFGEHVDKFDPTNPQHNEILKATYPDLAERANAAKLEGRTDWSPEDFKRSTLTHGKNASPTTQRVRAALLEKK